MWFAAGFSLLHLPVCPKQPSRSAETRRCLWPSNSQNAPRPRLVHILQNWRPALEAVVAPRKVHPDGARWPSSPREPHNRFNHYVAAVMFGCICGNCATFRTDRSGTTRNHDLLSIEDQSRTSGPYFFRPIVRANVNSDSGVNFHDCPSQAISPDI